MTLSATNVRPPEMPLPMLPVPMRIRRRVKETADTFTIELEPPDGTFAFEPGQFNMLYVFGVGEVPISISGDVSRRDVLVHTIRDVGTVTHALGRLKKGDWVGVRGPYGRGWPMKIAKGRDVILAAGGIGLAPLRPAIREVLDNRDDYGRVVVFYGARTPGDLLYPKEVVKWRARLDAKVSVTVDRADRTWHGNVGVITQLVSAARTDASRTIAMVCGPEIMMHYMRIHLAKLGIADEAIYVSMERNMKCAIGRCGHCQYGGDFICKDGPVFTFAEVESRFRIRSL
ncbi:MAG: FAD/NAD(P)-binding protein [Rhodothermales bacterium]